jgi:hypothetical protein
MSFKDENEFKTLMVRLQNEFDKKFPKPAPGTKPKKEHFYAFYDFYKTFPTEMMEEKIVCSNQMNNIKSITIKIYNISDNDFTSEYETWCENKTFPEY